MKPPRFGLKIKKGRVYKRVRFSWTSFSMLDGLCTQHFLQFCDVHQVQPNNVSRAVFRQKKPKLSVYEICGFMKC
jgi:hypothetical protein